METLPQAIVFDLDDTLLATGILAGARRQGAPRAIARPIHQVAPFAPVAGALGPEGIPTALAEAGVPVGVLTRSPRSYAERLLAQFRIRHHALVTGSDGYPATPDPASLIAIAQQLGVAAGRCIVVGGSALDHEAAAAAGALSIGVSWSGEPRPSWARSWPDIALADPALLLDYVHNLLDYAYDLPPLAEVLLAGRRPRWHWGTLIQPASRVYCVGRYFSSADLRRHPRHKLSALILKAKEDRGQARRLGELLAAAAHARHWQGKSPDLIASVPPAPDATWDRFEIIRPIVAEAFHARESTPLVAVETVEGYKTLAHRMREQANRDRFEATAEVAGRDVLLLDDVYTSGATVRACMRALRAARVRSVQVLAAGLTQTPQEESCPRCQEGRLRVRNGRRGLFIGCGNWPACDYTCELAPESAAPVRR